MTDDTTLMQKVIADLRAKNKDLTKVLKHIRKDAEMALSGEWDRSDDGFESQIWLIDQTIK